MKNALLEDGNQLLTMVSSFVKNFSDKMKDQNEKEKQAWNRTGAPFLNGSISKYSRDLIMTFPTMVDASLPADVASMISRANERNIASMLQLLFSAEQINGKSGREVLSMIHKNISVSADMDDIIDSIDDFVAYGKETVGQDTIKSVVNKAGSLSVSKPNFASKTDIARIVAAQQEALKLPAHSYPVESFSETSLNDYTVFNANGRMIVREDRQTNDLDDLLKIQNSNLNNQKFYKNRLDARKTGAEIDDLNDRIARGRRQDEWDLKDRDANLASQAQKDANMKDQNLQMNVDMLGKMLLDSDVKKANEMAPTLMIVNFNEVDTDGTIYGRRSFVTGVKSRLIAVDSIDIIERLIVKNKTKVNFLNFIRATTGEIKFFKDFIFCVQQAKIDAKNSVKKGPSAKMWKVLENRSTNNSINAAKRRGNDASAITTLVINQETVNIMKKQYDFDLEIPKNARMILEAYNLLGIVIADESIQVAKFLYAGNDMFEQQAYSYLEKESNDKSYKSVVNLLAKAGR